MFKLPYLRLRFLFLPNGSHFKLLSGVRRVIFRVYLTGARLGHEMRDNIILNLQPLYSLPQSQIRNYDLLG